MTLHLTILLLLPIVGALFGRYGAILGAVAALVFAIIATADFDSGVAGLQYVTDEVWIKQLGIHYKIGLDGLNLILVLLTTVLFLAVNLWIVLRENVERERLYLFFIALAETAVIGALLSQDLALFVIFFDLMLVPFLFITGIWGPKDTRADAIIKLFIYTLVGSLLMLVAAIAAAVLVADKSGNALSFAFSDLAKVKLSNTEQNWIFLGFAAAFLIKMPSFPFHGWMPDGYRNMPLPALAIFSAILSKVAAYGFLRVVTPLFPHATAHFQGLILVIALCSIVYGSAIAFTTTEARLVLGYSSMAQLGFIVLGVFALNGQGAQGALLQAVNHGLVVLPAFFIVGLLAARAGGSEDIRDMGGIALRAPFLALLFLIVAFANLAMPGSSNFVGEFLILLGVFNAHMTIALIAFTGVAMAAVYSLRLFIRAMHNRVGPEVDSKEIAFKDAFILVPLVATVLVLALYPQLPLSKSEKTVNSSIAAAKEQAK